MCDVILPGFYLPISPVQPAASKHRICGGLGRGISGSFDIAHACTDFSHRDQTRPQVKLEDVADVPDSLLESCRRCFQSVGMEGERSPIAAKYKWEIETVPRVSQCG